MILYNYVINIEAVFNELLIKNDVIIILKLAFNSKISNNSNTNT